ncbi:MAG: hypothetical protein Q4G59_00880 [Planctomycetia bacterium]|nr:hypothetical protein [Planctomycetia bacterium]
MTVSFFCTRCRALLQYPESSCGSIVYCPKCRQAVIVPLLTVAEANDAAETAQGQSDDEAVPVPEHTSRSIPIVNHLDAQAGEHLYSFGSDPNLMTTPEPVSDDEFFQRLRSEPVESRPVPPGLKPNSVSPQAPPPLEIEPVITDDSTPHSDGISGPFLTLIVMGILLALSAVGVFVYHLFPEMFQSGGKKEVVAQRLDPITIDGKVVYYDAEGRVQGDEGAIVMLLPIPFSSEPLVTGTLASNMPTPVDFTKHKEALIALGGSFGRAASDGFVDLKITRPGKYKVLYISAHVTRAHSSNDDKRIAEIEKFLFQPGQTLLSGYAFFLEERQLDATNFRVEFNFGKKD